MTVSLRDANDLSRLRIAYLCDMSPLDPNIYSGGNAHIHDALARHVGDVTILAPDWGLADPLRRLLHRLPIALNLRLRWRMHLLLAPLAARAVEKQLAQGDFDVLFTAYSYPALHRVRVPSGVLSAFTSDATPSIYRNSEIGQSFGSFFAPSRLIDPLIARTEKRTFRAADLLLWPSKWLRAAATERFGLDPERSLLVPWGANIEDPGIDPAPPRLDAKSPLELLFVGRDWFAKGGPMTMQILAALRARGIEARLTIIGCEPPGIAPAPDITLHPSLDKSMPDELALFEKAYRRAHFLVQPSMESYGFAFCEASAFGLPSLCYDVGGVPVREGRNGHLLALSSVPDDFVNFIDAHLADPASYDALRRSTRQEYENRLNWDAWGRSVAALFARHLQGKR